MSSGRARARPPLLALTLALCFAASTAQASILVLKDGRAVRYQGELSRKIGVVVFRLIDGTDVSVVERKVDWEATERANQLIEGRPAPRVIERKPEIPPPEESADAPAAPSFDELPEERTLGALLHSGVRRRTGPEEQPSGVGDSSFAVANRSVDLVPRLPSAEEKIEYAASTVPLWSGRLTERVMPLELLLPDPPQEIVIAEVPHADGLSPFRGEADPTDRLVEARLATLLSPAIVLPEPVAAGNPVDPNDGWNAKPGFVSPGPGDVVFGATRLEVRPAVRDDAIASIEYRVDGALVGTVKRAPWGVLWSVPRASRLHRITARVRHRDGGDESFRREVEAIVPDAQVDVDLVVLSATVTNQKYFFVRELEEQDFVLFEDGKQQKIAHFSRDPVPLSIVILADTSFSMNGKKLAMAADGVRRIAERLGPQDRVAVAGFDEKLTLLTPLSTDHDAAGSALAQVFADGTTAMFDSELDAFDLLRWEGGRKVLIVLGDGEDYTSASALEDVVDFAHRMNVVVYSVGLVTYRLRDGMPEHWATDLISRGRPKYWTDRLRIRGIKHLKRQSEETGGILYLPKFAGELPYVFEHILAELRNAYSISYYSANTARDGSFRKIELFVHGESLEVRTRRGYYSPDDRVARSPPLSGRRSTE